jgi:hypothetical protein
MTKPFTSDELQPIDLQTFTQGRLQATDPNVQFALDGALQAFRSHCMWHVTPVETETLTLDGTGVWGGLAVGIGGLYYASGSYMTGFLHRTRPGANSLYLPTKRLLGIKSIVENDVPVDISCVRWSQDGEVRKKNGQPWTGEFQGLTIEFEHGWTAKEAVDWRRYVLQAADRMSLVRGLLGPFNTDLGPYRVSGYYGTSRAGNMPKDASWLDDLFGLVDTKRYVRVEI